MALLPPRKEREAASVGHTHLTGLKQQAQNLVPSHSSFEESTRVQRASSNCSKLGWNSKSSDQLSSAKLQA